MLRSAILVSALLVGSAPLRAEVTLVDFAALDRLRESGVPIIDIRTREEWARTGVIEGSHLLEFAAARGHYDVEGWAKLLAGIAAPRKPVALICGSGRRSSVASRILDRQFGYEQVFDVTGGMQRWIAEGRATVRP